MSPYDLTFLNPIVIPSIIASVYIEEMFMLAYLQMYFTITLILLVMPSVKVTHHRDIWLFLFFIFPLQFSWYIPRKLFYRCLLMDTRMINSVSKGHHNISIKKISSRLLFVFSNFLEVRIQYNSLSNTQHLYML